MSGITYNIGDLEQLRKQFGPWADRNFPVPDGDSNKQLRWMMRACCGMSEELAELVEALGLIDLLNQKGDEDEAKDAVADIAIYSLSFMWHAEFQVQEVLLFDREPSRFEKEWITCNYEHRGTLPGNRAGKRAGLRALVVGLTYFIGKLSHHVLKTEQNIRKHENHWEQMRLCVCHIWRLMYRLTSSKYSRDLNEVVQAVGEKVLKRDWIKSPDRAHEVAE